jgi:two-component system CheB/CheR fusion protein
VAEAWAQLARWFLRKALFGKDDHLRSAGKAVSKSCPKGRKGESDRTPKEVRDGLAVVAVGASAGGLEAFQTLLDALPDKTGVAFVFVQHLDPSHESLLPTLLAGHTGMRVLEAEDGLAIEADTVIVIRPGTYLGIKDGQCAVSARDLAHGGRLPFDHLLEALAGSYGARGVCVILSGMGKDGSLGLKAVSQAGGLVLAQEPRQAGSRGMPDSAIATGLTDFVLPIPAIAGKLMEFSGSDPTADRKLAPTTAADGSTEIIGILRAQSGHDFTHYKRGTLERRIRHRMATGPTRYADLAAYVVRVAKDAAERDALGKDLLIHVTGFFRDPAAYEHLARSIIPDIVSTAADGTIRVWVAGCSSGEEAYSIAILFEEAIAAGGGQPRLQIFASDIDTDSIATARHGFYPSSIEGDVSRERLAKHFTVETGGYKVAASLRDRITFTVHDLVSDPPFSRLDLLTCRNLLIYLDAEAQRRAIELFHFALNEGGTLFLGSAETVGSAEGQFETMSRQHRIFRNGIGQDAASSAVEPGPAKPKEASKVARPAKNGTPPIRASLEETGRQMVLDNNGPAAVIASLDGECLYTMGPVDRYLAIARGQATTDLVTLARPGLRTRLRTAMLEAAHRQHTVAPRVTVDGPNGAPLDIDIRRFSESGEDFLLVCFIDRPQAAPPDAEALTQSNAPRIAELEIELEQTKLEFQHTIRSLERAGDEQKALNDETLSVNEEYQSSNEELVTSKEELQSLNEELTALNAQLQETLERQRTTFNDLQNVLNSTDVATIFLDDALGIRLFTPATRRVFGIIPSDVGRPLANLTPLVSDPTLLSDAATVRETGAPIEIEITTANDAWFLRRIQPYRRADGVQNGVVVTFADITARHQTAAALFAAKQEAEKATQAKSRFLAAASHDLRQPLQTLTLVQGLLAKTTVGERQKTLIDRFDLVLRSMTGMLNALLDLNQIEAGVMRQEITSVPLGKLLARLEGEFAYVAQAKGIEFRYVKTSKHVMSDPRLIEQMIRNLIANALKFTTKGKVLIGCRSHGASVSIEIWDSGIGIADAELKAIFDEYHQVDNAAREATKGLGLGLSIVRRLGALLRHPIRVSSTPGRGSMFAIDVPKAEATGLDTQAQEPVAAEEGPATTGTIMVIEDDRPVREMLEILLRDAGHYVMAVADPTAALDLAIRGALKPDIILSDYNLPGEANGIATALDLRTRLHVDTPIVIITGDTSTATLRTIEDQGFSRLHKPVGSAELITMIDGLLAGRGTKPAAFESQPDSAADPGAATIHVVDDDAHIRDKIRRVFADDGYMVETYDTCEAFLRSNRRSTPECLIVDAYLPGMSGLEMLARIKDRGDSIASIMITGESDVTIAVSAMKAGVSDFIEKPVTLTELQASVMRALARGSDTVRLATTRTEAVGLISLLT